MPVTSSTGINMTEAVFIKQFSHSMGDALKMWINLTLQVREFESIKTCNITFLGMPRVIISREPNCIKWEDFV
jgi:hypothetical protein